MRSKTRDRLALCAWDLSVYWTREWRSVSSDDFFNSFRLAQRYADWWHQMTGLESPSLVAIGG